MRRDEPTSDMPLTMWIAVRKGSSNGSARTAGQLRTELGMTNRMIAFVHRPDEPADLLRDMHVLGGAPAVGLLFTATNTQAGPWGSTTPASSRLDLPTLLDGLTPRGRDQMRARLTALCEGGERVGLDDALQQVRAWGARGRWSECALAAELIPHDLPGVTSAFDRLPVEQLAGLWQHSRTRCAWRARCPDTGIPGHEPKRLSHATTT